MNQKLFFVRVSTPSIYGGMIHVDRYYTDSEDAAEYAIVSRRAGYTVQAFAAIVDWMEVTVQYD